MPRSSKCLRRGIEIGIDHRQCRGQETCLACFGVGFIHAGYDPAQIGQSPYQHESRQEGRVQGPHIAVALKEGGPQVFKIRFVAILEQCRCHVELPESESAVVEIDEAQGLPVNEQVVGQLVALLDPRLTVVDGLSPGAMGILNLSTGAFNPVTDLVNIDPLDVDLKAPLERQRLAQLLRGDPGAPVGYALPLEWNFKAKTWISAPWGSPAAPKR